jgi:ABC-type sugar transport system, periplasmic component
MAKASVDPSKIKSWDDLLAAVKTLKTAGVTPIVVGGADKWPLHFYWTHLAVRLGGKAGFEAALRGENGGFEGEAFQKSGVLFKQLVDLQPFQNGFLGFKNPQAVGYFGDGKAAMILAISSFYHTQRALAADKVGLSDDKLGWVDFPVVPGGKGDRQTRSAASPAGSSPRARPRKPPTSSSSSSPRTCRRGLPPATSSFPSSRVARPASTAPS